ncbi:MAG: hypothetical protein DCF21_19560 [Leptolyngbya sp.]|uniref:Uncharacterized protein n=1 Tax=Shackletoniella antarctica TaxID=268115 RepID=A0A2W4W585_9CYAN|nr:MAG: hypothetical protein DCF17_12280 [Shackletoniella antarctica]PZV09467.1 MAG: hypothetical protein DCF21_19560 [Leptolyngbya sp.]
MASQSTAQAARPAAELTDLELAQTLAERLAIKPADWHRLNRDRRVRAKEQLAAALVFLLKDNSEEALARVEQASGWLNRSLEAPPCPSHGDRKPKLAKND